MRRYRIHRLKDWRRQSFRDAPPAAGPAQLKKKDYELGGEIEAASPYAAWRELRGAARAIDVGDALESESGDLFVCKYVGFEPAGWYLPPPEAPDPQPPAPSPQPPG